LLPQQAMKALELKKSIDNWSNNPALYTTAYTYVRLKNDKVEKNFLSQLNVISKQLLISAHFENGEKGYTFTCQNILKITPQRNLILENSDGFSYVTISFWIAFVGLLLSLTCFNYSNLTVARALTRAKEIGVRKVMGASRKAIIGQFVLEASVVTFLSFLISLAILPFIPLNDSVASLFYSVKIDLILILQFFGFSLFVGFIAGILPGIVLSRFKAIEVLKSLNTLSVFKGLKFKKVIICAQFVISLVLVFNVIVLFRQSAYMRNADYGFDYSRVVSIYGGNSKNIQFIRNRLSQYSEVKNTCLVSTNLGSHSTDFLPAFTVDKRNAINCSLYYIDQLK